MDNTENLQNSSKCHFFKEMGLHDSEEVNGNPALLKVHFSPILHDILQQTKAKQELQNRARIRLENGISEKQNRISELQTLIRKYESEEIANIKKRKIAKKEQLKKEKIHRKERVEKLRLKINRFKAEEEKLDGKTGKLSILGKLSFYVLWVLGIYLWVFYVFAVHGAIMREFESTTALVDALSGQDTVLGTTLFSSTPLVDAWQKSGLLGISLIILAPIVFLSIGIYSIIRSEDEERKGAKRKKFFFLYGNIFLAFFIDAIIAKDIVDAVHSVNYESDLVDQPLKFYTFLITTEFYIIMLLGFMSYLLWAGILRFYSKEKGKLARNQYLVFQDEESIIEEKAVIKALGEQIKDLDEIERSEINSVTALASNAKSEIQTIKEIIKNDEQKLDRHDTVPIIPKAEFTTNLDCYLKGWCLFITNNLPKKVSEKNISESIKIKETYLSTVLSSDEYIVVESIND